jgi:hypothetical protein
LCIESKHLLYKEFFSEKKMSFSSSSKEEREEEEEKTKRRITVFNRKKWLVMMVFAISYTIFQICVGNSIDKKFTRDSSEVLAVNFLMRNVHDKLLWKPCKKFQAKMNFEKFETKINQEQQNSMIDEEFLKRSMLHQEIKSDEDDDDGEEESKGSSSSPPSLFKELEEEDKKKKGGSIHSAMKQDCRNFPVSFDPFAFYPYFLNRNCSFLETKNFSRERTNEILEKYSKGIVETKKNNARELYEWFKVFSAISWCSRDIVVDQRNHLNPNAFSIHSFLKSSVCFEECFYASSNSLPGNKEITDPWFTIDWISNNESIVNDTRNILDTMFVTHDYKVVQSFRPKYSWMYSCDIKKEITERGSALVVFDTSWEFLINYKSGVYSLENIDADTSKTSRRLSIVLVGWGVEEIEQVGLVRYFLGTMPYGNEWGLSGYIKINENDLYLKGSRSVFLRGVYVLSLKKK